VTSGPKKGLGQNSFLVHHFISLIITGYHRRFDMFESSRSDEMDANLVSKACGRLKARSLLLGNPQTSN